MADSSSIKTMQARTGAGVISWLEAGEGSALVLLHGVGSAARSWSAQLETLACEHRVIAWNAPGYAGSAPLSEAAPDAQAYADALAALLDHLGVRRCHLVGHSLGALMAARFARAYPQRVLSLTLASCALGHRRLPAPERERLLASRLDDVEKLGARGMAEKRGPRLLSPAAPPQMIRAVVDAMANIDPQGYAQAARMLSQGDLIADIEALAPQTPVQFIWGDADVITPPAANLKAAAARPGAPTLTLEGAGHACYVERADAFSKAIADFTRTHDERTGS